tara:strand:+ start:1097 stop:1630 length:534 start_codon:yes stop_codon:yes gene_type:complete
MNSKSNIYLNSGSTSWNMPNNIIWQSRPQTTLFHKNSYTKKLNQLLTYERSAFKIYECCKRRKATPNQWKTFETCTATHKIAENALRLLIIKNRDLPVDQYRSLPGDFSLTLVQASKIMPISFKRHTINSSCTNFELWLLNNYNQAIYLAPKSDKAMLINLKSESSKLLHSLRKNKV